MLMSMLYSRIDFNALKILVESGKFCLTEPLLFHMKLENALQWSLVVLDPIGAAMLIDMCHECDASNYYPLLNTLLLSYRMNLNVEVRAMELWPQQKASAIGCKWVA